MIQRIQTLYLFLVVILGTLLCFFSPVQFLLPDGTEYIALHAFDKWPLAVMSVSIPLLALVIIFLFKRRLLQARLNIVNVTSLHTAVCFINDEVQTIKLGSGSVLNGFPNGILPGIGSTA